MLGQTSRSQGAIASPGNETADAWCEVLCGDERTHTWIRGVSGEQNPDEEVELADVTGLVHRPFADGLV
ncbi:MAG: hypothetical protein ACR2JG_08875 [Geodermatophilaceae bacterium]